MRFYLIVFIFLIENYLHNHTIIYKLVYLYTYSHLEFTQSPIVCGINTRPNKPRFGSNRLNHGLRRTFFSTYMHNNIMCIRRTTEIIL